MAVILYPIYTLASLILFQRLRGQVRTAQVQFSGRTFLLTAIMALIYDNLVLSIGHLLGHGDLLRALSIPRFLFPVLFMPLLIITLLDFAVEAGSDWAANRWIRLLAWLAVLLAIVYGLLTEYFALELVSVTYMGALLYSPAEPVPPLAAQFVLLLALLFGLQYMRLKRWYWLAAGAVVFFALGLIPLSEYAQIVLPAGEIVFFWSLVATDRFLDAEKFSMSDEEISKRFQKL